VSFEEESAPAPAPSSDSDGPCPKCGSETGFYVGYGLCGGGIGVYEGCDDCKYFSKTQDEEEG
jgi:hypothetical protein